MSFIFEPPATSSLPIAGSDQRFPVNRIYCIGLNYVAHARESSSQTVSRANPVFFMKPANAIVAQGGDIPYPSATQNLHHEVEMVAALAHGGRDISTGQAPDCVFGYGVGLDLTRRDLQAAMKAKGSPWDIAKGFDNSAPISELHPVKDVGHPSSGRLSIAVNGEVHQDTDIADMIFSTAEIIAELSRLFELKAGDLIFTGTPAGVGPLAPGDRFRAELQGIAVLEGRMV